MSEDDLRGFAEVEGNAFAGCDPTDPSWLWAAEAFDVARVVGAAVITASGRPMDREAWLQWLNEEIGESVRGDGYIARLAVVLRETPDLLPPVVVAVHPDERIEIGDGWHRFALAVRDGITTLNAVVGRRK